MKKKYIVRVSEQERQTCSEVITKLTGTSQRVRRAQMLLKADADGPAWTDAKIAEAFTCRMQTIEHLRKRLVTEGFALVLNAKNRTEAPTPPRLDGHGEAQLLALRLGKPPAGDGQWTLRLLAEALVALEVVESIRHETVRQRLKKNGMTTRMVAYWVIPPDAEAECVATMEEVLDVYERPHDPNRPVLCMDEQPVQLLKETQVPIEATKHHGTRVDYAYERAGTASIVMFVEPLAGFRQATARAQRTKVDWALEVAHLLDTRYADVDLVTLVSDNVNTHTKGAFYATCEPARARASVRRLDCVHTPKHGSWLHSAECELRSMTRPCLHGRRLGALG